MAALRAAFCAACVLTVACSRPDPVIIAPANTTEQKILAEIVGRRLQQAGITVQQASPYPSLGTAHQALLAHAADIAIEYSGAAWMGTLHHPKPEDASRLNAQLRTEYSALQLRWFDSLGFSNPYVLLARCDPGLRTISDLERGPARSFAATKEFLIRPDGQSTLMSTYPGLRWNRVGEVLVFGRTDVLAMPVTNGAQPGSGYCALDDDHHAFPPEEAAIVARFDSLSAHPGIEAALTSLSGTISRETMQRLNAEVDVQHRSIAAVAADIAH